MNKEILATCHDTRDQSSHWFVYTCILSSDAAPPSPSRTLIRGDEAVALGHVEPAHREHRQPFDGGIRGHAFPSTAIKAGYATSAARPTPEPHHFTVPVDFVAAAIATKVTCRRHNGRQGKVTSAVVQHLKEKWEVDRCRGSIRKLRVAAHEAIISTQALTCKLPSPKQSPQMRLGPDQKINAVTIPPGKPA